MSRASVGLSSFVLASLAWLLLSAQSIPALQGRVNDYADMLSAAAEARIESTLEQLETDKGSQVVVLTIDTLGEQVLEDYSIRVAEAWQIGRGEHDDGAILLISEEDRKMRLEVGYGLEPVLTDAMSRRILDNVIAPSFRAGDFDGGVERAVDAIDGLVRGTSTLPEPTAAEQIEQLPFSLFAIFWLLILLPLAASVVLTKPFKLLPYIFLMPFTFTGGASLGGQAAGLGLLLLWAVGAPLLWMLLSRAAPPPRRGGRRSWSSDRGWYGGGGFGRGGGFGGGGFGGGGGGFGGGGASSGW
jgi:uncharacterized protein